MYEGGINVDDQTLIDLYWARDEKQSEKLLLNTGNYVDTLQTISSKMPRTAKNA